MSVAAKLFAILAFVALAPLGVFAVSALREHEHALGDEVAALHHKTTEHGARSTQTELDSLLRTLRGFAGAIPWPDLSSEERAGALLLVYRQLDGVGIVSLLDEHGNGVGATVYQTKADDRHTAAPETTLVAFARAIPFTATQATGTIGAPFEIAGEAPMVPLTVHVAGANAARWVLAIGVSLRGLCGELAAASPAGVSTRLEDARGQLLCGVRGTSRDVLSASTKLANGWIVTAEQPSDAAFASLRRVRIQSVIWFVLGVLGAIAAGLVLTQAIRRPLRQLTKGAEAVAGGNLGYRVAITSRDEFGTLASSFNRMSGEIEKQNLEIRAWNEELQKRVDVRTAELKDAQDQLLQSRKLGAVAALGAGIAHEINNPLAGVVGLTQVLLARKDSYDERTMKTLGSIERESLRIRGIIDRMSSLAQASVTDAVRVDVTTIVDAATRQHTEQLAAARVEIVRAYGEAVPQILGNAAQLQHAIGQLVDNSIRAMPGGGRLRLTVRAIENELVAIDVEDTGRGIAPELIHKVFEPFFTGKENWRGTGLGLAIVHRIVEAHQGRIRAVSELGAGTTMTVTLPAASRAAHLA
jgi:two-component system NtrC family sensor kinase